MNSPEGSIHRKLYDTKRLPDTDPMDNDLFIPHLLSRDKTAFYVPYEMVSGFGNKACGIYAPYVEKYPNLASVAFPKNSPYYQFFQYRLLLMVQNGQWNIIQKRLIHQNCEASKEDVSQTTSMGMDKLSFLFGIISFGYTLAVLIFIHEVLRPRLLM